MTANSGLNTFKIFKLSVQVSRCACAAVASTDEIEAETEVAMGTVNWFDDIKGYGLSSRMTAARTCSCTSAP